MYCGLTIRMIRAFNVPKHCLKKQVTYLYVMVSQKERNTKFQKEGYEKQQMVGPPTTKKDNHYCSPF